MSPECACLDFGNNITLTIPRSRLIFQEDLFIIFWLDPDCIYLDDFYSLFEVSITYPA